ncbi:hypothetical protein LEP1GSC192_1104 [Leptospira sp. B5-022]|nr:hypothetical protein LEP1GSC192_1104 [Leptospira sp. B5-022]
MINPYSWHRSWVVGGFYDLISELSEFDVIVLKKINFQI